MIYSNDSDMTIESANCGWIPSPIYSTFQNSDVHNVQYDFLWHNNLSSILLHFILQTCNYLNFESKLALIIKIRQLGSYITHKSAHNCVD